VNRSLDGRPKNTVEENNRSLGDRLGDDPCFDVTLGGMRICFNFIGFKVVHWCCCANVLFNGYDCVNGLCIKNFLFKVTSKDAAAASGRLSFAARAEGPISRRNFVKIRLTLPCEYSLQSSIPAFG
jgi:hypothetical protein